MSRSAVRLPAQDPLAPFAAIDFETADHGWDSACAVALVRVERLEIVERVVRLIQPPRRSFAFTHVHGITWQDVADQPTFAQVWPEMARLLEGARYFAAHNATFDRTVLQTCCGAARLEMPRLPFECTMWLARRTWGLARASLPAVCAHLRLPLRHHDAGSDAEACARIVIAALQARPNKGPVL